MRPVLTGVLLALGAVPVPAQEPALRPIAAPALAAAEQELLHVFDRPAGTTIGDEQKQRLAAFLDCHRGQDLQHLGYAEALRRYLDRDYDGAVAALDEFFARQPEIRSADHRTMAGRIYLNAVSRAIRAEAPDAARLAGWSERMARLYHDTAMLERMSQALLPKVADPAPLRVALARGVFASDLTDAQKDAFLRSLYAGEPAAPAAPARGDAARPAATATAGGYAVGDLVEALPVARVLNGTFELQALRGKVVVLDFFATWCPPCRASVPDMVALQDELGDAVQVVCVTRFYGRGMDFTGGKTTPHGGEAVKDLDEAREVAVNEAFVAAFAVDYPVVFTQGNVGGERFGVSGIPTMVVIGKDGRYVGKVTGAGAAQHRELRAMIDRARR